MTKSHIYKTTIILFACFILLGCAPSKRVIGPLKQCDDIGISIPKNAHIYWLPGRNVAYKIPPEAPTSIGYNYNGNPLAGIVATLAVNAIKGQHRKNNPSNYVNEYGKADEVVFITSLRDTLEKQNIFKDASITTEPNEISPKDVLIKVYFKTARVRDGADVVLTVKLSIITGKKPAFERTYLIYNDKDKSKNFFENKNETSQMLLAEIMKGIKQWHRGEK